MKSNSVELYNWRFKNEPDTIEIDWPKVHKKVGTDLINWIIKQPKDKCQLVVDKVQQEYKLIAEFYDEHTLITYHLMWAK